MPIEHNPQDIADLIAASVEAMQMKHNYATVKSGRVIMPELNESLCCQPSELELRLRKEIMANLNQIYALLPERNADNTINCIYMTLKVTDMLKVLWGEK